MLSLVLWFIFQNHFTMKIMEFILLVCHYDRMVTEKGGLEDDAETEAIKGTIL